MQQLSRTCKVAGHKENVIEYVCTYSQCQLSRFLCSECVLEISHKHDQQYNSHIVDVRDFFEMIKNKLEHAKGKQQQKKLDIEKSIVPLKQLMQEIYNLLKNIQNIIQQVKQGKLQNNNVNILENWLLNIQQYGFNQIDDQQLNNLVNISEQYQDFEIYKQLQDQANLIIQNALKVKQWCLQYVENTQQLSQSQKIKEAKYQIPNINDTGENNMNNIQTGAIPNDSQYIESGGEDKLLKIWDNQSNQLIKQIRLNNSVSSCIEQDEANIKMHKKSNILNLIQVQAYSITIFQALDQRQLQPHYNDNRFQEFLQFYNDDNFQRELKLIISQDKESKIFSQNILIEQIQTQNLKMENDIIFSAAICYDEKYLGFCSYSGQLQIFNIKEQICYNIKEVKSATVCTFKPNSYQLISGTHDGQIICFDGSDQFNIQYQNKIHNDKINGIKFINDSTIITCSNDKDIIITDLENNQLQQKIANAHDNNIMSIDYNYSMKIIASCSLDSSIRIWSLKGDQIDIVNQAHQDFIMQIQFLESKSLLISLCFNGELKLWELSEQKKIEFISLIRSNDKIFYFQYVQDCSILIIACQEYLQIMNFESGSLKIINNISNYVYGQITQANPKNVLLIKGKGINQIQQDVITIMHKIL